MKKTQKIMPIVIFVLIIFLHAYLVNINAINWLNAASTKMWMIIHIAFFIVFLARLIWLVNKKNNDEKRN